MKYVLLFILSLWEFKLYCQINLPDSIHYRIITGALENDKKFIYKDNGQCSWNANYLYMYNFQLLSKVQFNQLELFNAKLVLIEGDSSFIRNFDLGIDKTSVLVNLFGNQAKRGVFWAFSDSLIQYKNTNWLMEYLKSKTSSTYFQINHNPIIRDSKYFKKVISNKKITRIYYLEKLKFPNCKTAVQFNIVKVETSILD